MADFQRVCVVEDVPQNTRKKFEITNKTILLVHIGDNYYAMDGICSHRGGDLSKGKLKNKVIRCPRHGTEFDVTTGKVVKNVNSIIKALTRAEAKDLSTYPTKVEAGAVWVQV